MLSFVNRLNEADAMSIAEAHFAAMTKGKYLRKLDKRQVSRVEFNAETYIVKAYRRNVLYRFFHMNPGNTRGVAKLEGLTPPCLADFLFDKNWQVTIYQDAGNANFFYHEDFLAECQNVLGAYAGAGSLLGQIHKRNLYHADTKPPNFVLNKNIPTLPPVVIVDCDRVLSYGKLPEKRWLFNLAQFFIGAPPFHDEDLLPLALDAFLKSYMDTVGIPVDSFSALQGKIFALAVSHPKIEKHLPLDFFVKKWNNNEPSI